VTTETPLSKHVAVDLSPARVARVWAAVSSRIEVTPRAGRRWLARGVLGLGVAGALAGGAFLIMGRQGDTGVSAFQRAALETAGDAMAVKLDDGSRLELSAHTRLRVTENQPSSVALDLERGRVDLDITPRPGRHFSVLAAGVEVRVTGTRFSVELGPNRRVEVEVERGSVEVSWPGNRAKRRLGAGERWSVDLTEPAARDTSEPRPAAEAPRATASTPSTDPGRPAAAPSPREPAVAGARELFDLGNAARRAGDAAGAARAYELLLEHHAGDARAGLAAFELGRLRMDRLGDVHGAIQALQRAVALAPGAGFREDAMARLVDAYSAAGSMERCRSAQAAYLDAYPSGVRASAVARRCRTP